MLVYACVSGNWKTERMEKGKILEHFENENGDE